MYARFGGLENSKIKLKQRNLRAMLPKRKGLKSSALAVIRTTGSWHSSAGLEGDTGESVLFLYL